MPTTFYKYQGTGNDFVMIDDRQKHFPSQDQAYIAKLCDRRFGIGADGLILLQGHETLDFRMVYFNADGNLSSFCGNGGRCVLAFAHKLGIFEQQATFEAYDGEHRGEILDTATKEVALEMQAVATLEEIDGQTCFLDTGSPHVVKFVEETAQFPVVSEGRKIRNGDRFVSEGVNVNFVKLEENKLHVRTYERGVEDETLSCGTGVTAAALALANQDLTRSSVSVKTLGGDLRVTFERDKPRGFKNIKLVGPATFVFSGQLPSREF